MLDRGAAGRAAPNCSWSLRYAAVAAARLSTARRGRDVAARSDSFAEPHRGRERRWGGQTSGPCRLAPATGLIRLGSIRRPERRFVSATSFGWERRSSELVTIPRERDAGKTGGAHCQPSKEASTRKRAESAPGAVASTSDIDPARAAALVDEAEQLVARWFRPGRWPAPGELHELFSGDRFEHFLSLYTQAMKFDPGEPAHPWNLASTLNRVGLNDLALGFMLRAIQTARESGDQEWSGPDALIALAEIALDAGQHELARQALGRAASEAKHEHSMLAIRRLMLEVVEGDDASPQRVESVMATTHPVGDVRFAPEALEGLITQLNEAPKPVIAEHDLTRPPIGRTVGGRLADLPDGELAVVAEFELFPPGAGELVRLRALSPTMIPAANSPAPLELAIDWRSYDQRDLLELLARPAERVGPTEAHSAIGRFSQVPDPLLVIGLGSAATAGWWFARGFFTRAGEALGEAVGEDVVQFYEELKTGVRTLVARRKTQDATPVTLFTFTIPVGEAHQIDVEGSTRATSAEALAAFLDSGADLVRLATSIVNAVPEPARFAKLHFAFDEESRHWWLVYAYDTEIRPLLLTPETDESEPA
jgi:hypothetical protein